jgi:hypothetical protein
MFEIPHMQNIFLRNSRTGAGALAAVGQADSGPSGHVVVQADIFVDKKEDTITWL